MSTLRVRQKNMEVEADEDDRRGKYGDEDEVETQTTLLSIYKIGLTLPTCKVSIEVIKRRPKCTSYKNCFSLSQHILGLDIWEFKFSFLLQWLISVCVCVFNACISVYL